MRKEIEIIGGTVVIEDNMLMSTGLRAEDSPEYVEYNSAVDGVESLILALAMEGYDISDPKFISALNTTMDALSNNLG